jgi:hypothetical protein
VNRVKYRKRQETIKLKREKLRERRWEKHPYIL